MDCTWGRGAAGGGAWLGLEKGLGACAGARLEVGLGRSAARRRGLAGARGGAWLGDGACLSGVERVWETQLLQEEVRQEKRSLAGGQDEAGNQGLIRPTKFSCDWLG